MPAQIVNHPSFVPKLEPFMFLEPVTEESIARAKAVQKLERTRAVAAFLAGFDGVTYATTTSPIRAHYLAAAGLAMDAAARKELSL